MSIKQYEIWIADLNPQIGTEPGKTRPVLVLQTNLLNKIPHPSTIICPITTNVEKDADILRVHLKKGMANLNENCDIMIDQIRAIDNKRLIKKIGDLPSSLIERAKENIKGAVVLNIEEISSRMFRFGKSLLIDNKVLPIDKILNKIDSVSIRDIYEISNKYFSADRKNIAILGEVSKEVLKELK